METARVAVGEHPSVKSTMNSDERVVGVAKFVENPSLTIWLWTITIDSKKKKKYENKNTERRILETSAPT